MSTCEAGEYSKGELIIEEGSEACDFGIVLSGNARAVKWDSSGRLIIISLLSQGSEIGAILAAGFEHRSPVTVQAQDAVSVLWISFEKVFARCKNACPRHERVLRNYINIIAQKGLILHERLDCLLRPSVREKILAYLGRESREQRDAEISVPLDRNAMAEYLNVERSALSRELSSMKRDGLIDYRKNIFIVK